MRRLALLVMLGLGACSSSDRGGNEEVTLHVSGEASGPAAPARAPVARAPRPPPAPKPPQIEVVVESDPPGAAVQLDRQALGVTPISTVRPRSDVASARVKVSLPGYRTIEKTVHFDKDQHLSFALAKDAPVARPAPEEDYKLDDLKDPYSADKQQ
jgi:hypothetical protein